MVDVFFSGLEKLSGDVGAREVVVASKSSVREVVVPDRGIHEDIDTQDELNRFLYRANRV